MNQYNFAHKYLKFMFNTRLTAFIILYLSIFSDKLLFKNYFCFFDFANMNDRMTGASTAFGLLYNVNFGCLVSSLFLVSCEAEKKGFYYFSLTLSKHIKITKEIYLYFWLTLLLMMKGG